MGMNEDQMMSLVEFSSDEDGENDVSETRAETMTF
jgi:hypothetical protein